MKVTASTVAPLPSTIVKMEDRKRPAGQNVDDLAPPTKRQAVNGGSKASADSDMPWKDDLEVRVTQPPKKICFFCPTAFLPK
jgi:E3 ubiquitin-protein ligase BRE1